MGRSIKIQKYGTSQGITINANGTVNQPAAGVGIDIGFPDFASLTDPVYNNPDTLEPTNYLGVVGGLSSSATSATNPIILPQVNISLADGSSTGAGNGRIVRQKGAHKFLVAYVASATSAGSFIVGQAYMVSTVGTTTDWNAVGHADGNVAVGDIFTATAVGSGNGAAYPVGQCVLSNTATPAAGYMSVEFSTGGDSTLKFASYITNKWVRDWTGMTYGNYSDSNSGTNNYSGENFYPTNFFTDEGTVTWSGAELINSANAQNGSLPLAQIVNATS